MVCISSYDCSDGQVCRENTAGGIKTCQVYSDCGDDCDLGQFCDADDDCQDGDYTTVRFLLS